MPPVDSRVFKRPSASEVEASLRAMNKSGAREFQVLGAVRDASAEALARIEARNSADPKVFAPFVTPAHEPPRPVLVERKRLEFEGVDLEEALLRLGVNLRLPDPHQFGFELFDDKAYETRTSDEWRSLGLPLEARYLYQGSWVDCRVVGVSDQNLDSLEIESVVLGPSETRVPRLFVYIKGDDPLRFARRIKWAIDLRDVSELLTRYSFALDCIPVDDALAMDTDRVARLLALARNGEGLRNAKLDAKALVLLKEVALEYGKCENKLLFDKAIKAMSVSTPSPSIPPAVRAMVLEGFGVEALQTKLSASPAVRAFLSPVHTQRQPSILTPGAVRGTGVGALGVRVVPEVSRTLTEIRTLSEALLKASEGVRVFDGGARSQRLEVFRQTLKNQITNARSKVKEEWVGGVTSVVLKHIGPLGKGWFNVQETNMETYKLGKLVKVMGVVKLMMQDTLRDVVGKIVADFERMTCGSVSAPLFTVDVRVSTSASNEAGDAWYRFGVDVTGFGDSALEALEEAISSVTVNVPHVEAAVVPQLFKVVGKHNKTTLAGVSSEEAWIVAVKERSKHRLAVEVERLHAEVKKALEPFREIATMDVSKTLETAGGSEESLKQEIERSRIKLQTVLREIPESILVGELYEVTLTEVRRVVEHKYTQLIEQLNHKLLLRYREVASAALKTYEEKVLAVLHTVPEDIEKLTELKDFMGSLQGEILNKLNQETSLAMDTYKYLEKGKYRSIVSADDTALRWRLFHCGRRLAEAVHKAQSLWSTLEKQFGEDLKQEQLAFEESLKDLETVVGKFGEQHWNLSECKTIAATAEAVTQQIKEAIAQSKLFTQREALLGKAGVDQGFGARLTAANKEWEPYAQFWVVANMWLTENKGWLEGGFDTVNADDVENKVYGGIKTLGRVALKVTAKYGEEGKLQKSVQEIKMALESFSPKVPIIKALRNDGIRDRHWEELWTLLGTQVDKEGLTLSSLLDLGALAHVEKIAELGERIGREFSIEKQLKKMKSEWEGVEFANSKEPYKKTNTYILKGSDVASSLLDEHIVLIQAMQFSIFNKPFKPEIDEFAGKLMQVSECLELWLKVQKAWMYLQPIFDAPDIITQLPNEAKRFRAVDTTWRNVMNGKVFNNPNVFACCLIDGLVDKWSQAVRELDAVQKGLEEYLELKRAAFARFYFLSNDELLEILSQTKDPTAVQPFLNKVFEAMQSLRFVQAPGALCVAEAMSSADGETVPFVTPVTITSSKPVEVWMGEIETAMKEGVRAAFENAVLSYKNGERTTWACSNVAQTVLNGSQVHWTHEVETALVSGTISQYFDVLNKQLIDLVNLVRSGLKKDLRTTIGALVVIDVHAKDVVESLAEMSTSVLSVNSFEWIKQLRFYWQSSTTGGNAGRADCIVKMVQASFPYGYEYLGNSMRLVITPLTDMCYMTILSAHALSLSAAPNGPAGTGKTETTKDLGKALATQTVVYNCDPNLTFEMVGKFFKGLASAGSWICFDEFNRISVEVLSVIAQQLLVLLNEKSTLGFGETKEVEFEGSIVKLKPTFHVIATSNPGYAGRSELPSNLESLFRGVSMAVPSYAMIGEILLYAYGYTSSRVLAEKMVSTFKLASEQLSSQDFYDYGMRAVKSTIEAAGILKRQNPDEEESKLLLRALRDVNVPKFVAEDIPLFEAIISDLFPGVERPVVDYGRLKEQVVEEMRRNKLQPCEYALLKQLQLFDTLNVRHGLMLVGPTGGGKTVTYRTLQTAISDLHGKKEPGFQRILTHVLNPKSIRQEELYGAFDEVTNEWSDGIASTEIRQAVRDTSPGTDHWIMFDGPVDALWVESMNSVLDDNKKLCLVSGEIVALGANIKMLFEVEDLAVASPATVSRCGMVYIEPGSLGLEVLIDSYIESLPEALRKFAPGALSRVRDLFAGIIPLSIQFAKKKCKEILYAIENNICMSVLRLFDSLVRKNFEVTEARNLESFREPVEALEFEHLASVALFSIVWAVGGILQPASRGLFNAYLRSCIDNVEEEKILTKLDKAAGLQLLPKLECNLEKLNAPADMFGNAFDWNEKQWVSWEKTVPEYEIPRGTKYEDIVVPTADSIRVGFVFKVLSVAGYHSISVGASGTGKSVNILEFLQRQAPDNITSISINFSAQTKVSQLQDNIDGKLEKRRRGVFGPPAGKQLILFIDDLNMPQKEYYGAQPPIELLRQYLDHGGWFDRDELQFRRVVDTTIVGAMGLPGGGRTFISERFKRHFNIIGYGEMSTDSVEFLFGTICRYFFANFDESIRDTLIPKLISAQTRLFDAVKEDLLPTPTKSHYTFNLRDIWKTFLGLCSITAKSSNSELAVIRCWVHEVNRVFGDRLVDDYDRSWLKEKVDSEIKNLGESYSLEEVYNAERILFGRFLNPETLEYQQITDMGKLQDSIYEYLEAYNNSAPHPMALVMFLDACEHTCRIARIIDQPKGNALLLGVGGSGRQSLTRLATFINDFECVQVEVVRGYGMPEFRDDVKSSLLKCGVEYRRVTFILADTQIVNEQMVEVVNSIINSGDVPNLYKPEDLDAINSACRPICVQLGIAPTKANVFSVYVGRVLKNVHFVLAFSPAGEQFRNRIRMFPALVNCCTIDWFAEWPGEALLSVATQQIGAQQDELQLKNLEGTLSALRFIHQSVERKSIEYWNVNKRKVYNTPTSFLELLNTYVTVLKARRSDLGTFKHRYASGLEKIFSAEKQVSELQVSLIELRPVLEQTSKEVAEMMEVIKRDKESAAETQKVVSQEEAEAGRKADETKAIKDDAQRDLDEALPALEVAVQSLKKLKVEHIREVKALANPPAGVRLTMEAVCIMMDVKPVMKPHPEKIGQKIPDYWEASQKELLPDPKRLLDMLFEYDKDHIKDSVIQKISPYMDREDFDPANVKKASVACEAMCLWTRAMYKYHHVALAVEPKRQKLREAEAELQETMERLANAQESLRVVNEKIAKLERDFNAAIAKQEQLQRDLQLCEVKLNRAHKLLGGLGGEKARWGSIVEELSKSLEVVPGDCIVAAGGIAYLGPFTTEYRQALEKTWREYLSTEVGVPISPNCSLRSVLGDPVKIQQWIVYQLPKDAVSIENGIIMDKCRRWPLLIDPQRQGNKYIKNLGKQSDNGIDICKLTDPNFLRTIEMAIQFGRWVLIENIGLDLDPAIEPVLLQQKQRDGSQYVIKLGDKTVTYSDQFRLFLTTTLSNPHYSPETSVKVTLLNFAITPEGLEDQMLAIVVAKERPELEEQKTSLLVQNAKMSRQLKELEDEILKLLAASTGDVLEDDVLINAIARVKQTAAEVEEKRKLSVSTEVQIDLARESYRPVAFRASQLFFVVVDLVSIDPMYQYSLQWFGLLFSLGIDQCPKNLSDTSLETRLRNLDEYFLYLLYQNVCRGLFEKDKLLFSLALCIKLLTVAGTLNQEQVRFLLTGPTSDVGGVIGPEWLGSREWKELSAIEKAFIPGLAVSFTGESAGEWQAVYDSADAHTHKFPEPFESNLSRLERLLVIRALRLDKLIPAIVLFVAEHIGAKYVEPPTFDITKSFTDSTSTTPLVFILSPGSDPVADVLRFAEAKGMSKRLDGISLGQGQGPKAKKLIEAASSSGGWVLLQNCHLAISWMPTLERIVETFTPDNTHPNFRLWLTSMPSPGFPVQVLQAGVKMTNEPPKGLRANLLKTYSQLVSDSMFAESKRPDVLRRLLFGFAFFHAIVQDRRKFGPIGWNIPYGFTNEDFAVCRRQLAFFVNEYEEVPYKVLNYLGAAINYGGRVTDDKDKILIKTVLEKYVCADLVQQGEQYKLSESNLYFCPDKALTANDFVEYVKTLPSIPAPEAFGMHENCNITTAQAEAQTLVEGILAMAPGGGAGGGSSGGGVKFEDVVDKLADELLAKIPAAFDYEVVDKRFPTKYEESLNTVLKQEVIRYNKLIKVARSSLVELKKALKGQVVMSAELDKVAQQLFVNSVPQMWADKGFLSLKPLSSWIIDLVARVDFLNQWSEHGTPAVFWMSGFFFPQAFLTGTLQNFARRHVVAIDRLQFTFAILDRIREEISTPPEQGGVFIHGLYVEGCRWSREEHMLNDSRPKELFCVLPVLHFLPVIDKETVTGVYRCPTYKVVSRRGVLSTTGHSTNFILNIELPTDRPSNKWVLAGVAAFLSLKY